MKALLFNVPIKFNSWQNTEAPMGVSYIASLLKRNNHEVRIKDFEVEKFSEQILIDIVEKFKPDIAGVSFRTPSFYSAKVVCSILKQVSSSLPVVLGGPHATAFPEETIRVSQADMVVRGEGEFAMAEILDALNEKISFADIRGLSYRKNDSIYHNSDRPPLDNIDILPWPARELLPVESYNIDVVLSSRGCPFDCSYCDKVISSRIVKYRAAEDVVNEIIYIKERYKKPAFYFIDEHFLANKKRAEQILDLLLKAKKEKNIHLRWIAQSRVDAIEERILRKAKEAGCYEIHYGLETGDETELAFINKRTTLKQSEEAVRIAKRCGIHIRGNFMLGFPISTHQTIKNSIRFAKKLPIDRYRFFIVSPLPNTKMWDYIITHKQLAEDFDWDCDHFLSSAIKIDGLSKEDIIVYIGVAYLHTLKKWFLAEIFSPLAFFKFLKIIYLIFKTRRIRGDKFSVYFPKATNLFLELWLLIENLVFTKKIKFLAKIVRIERKLEHDNKGSAKKLSSYRAISKDMEKFYQSSEVYYRELKTVANRKHYSPYFKYVRRYAKEQSRLLDLGCGLGVVPYFFSLEGYDAYGIDVSFKFLSYSGLSQNHQLHYISGNVFNLPFKDEIFDVVGNFDVIEHIPDVRTFLIEGMRVLKKDGILVIVCPSILTPFTPIKAIFSSKESHSIYTNRWTALTRIFINTILILRKKLSSKTIFYYRQPLLNEKAWRRETDTVYQTSPIDLKNFLRENNMEIIHYQKDGPNFLHRIVGKILPDFASTIYLVALKKC